MLFSHGRIFSHLPTLRDHLWALLESLKTTALSSGEAENAPSITTPPFSIGFDDGNQANNHTITYQKIHSQLEDIYSLVIALPTPLAKDHESIPKLLDLAYSLRYEHDLKDVVMSNCHNATGRALIHQIELLGRIKAAYFAFLNAIRTFTNFGDINYIPDPPVKPPRKILQPSRGRLSLEQTLGLFKLRFEASAVKKVTGKNWTFGKFKAEFTSLQSVELPTHAEVQMILLLMTRGITLGSVYPYIGCSKLSCFLCFSFVQACEYFEFRGSHHRIFPKWCLPLATGLQESNVDLLQQCVKNVRKGVSRAILTPIVETAKLNATSTADVTSIYSAENDKFRTERLARSLPFHGSSRMRGLQHQLLRDQFGQ